MLIYFEMQCSCIAGDWFWGCYMLESRSKQKCIHSQPKDILLVKTVILDSLEDFLHPLQYNGFQKSSLLSN